MLIQILVMDAGGITLFSWTPRDLPSDPTLISGFLTALNMFALHERGENIRRIRLDPTTFLFERIENLLFVLLIRDEKFEKIYERILVDLKNQFIQTYKEILQNFDGNTALFQGFTDQTEQILRDYAYFDYIKLYSKFDTLESLHCILFLDNISGKIEYIRAKEYLDREILEFQATVLIHAAVRVVSEILHEVFFEAFLITTTNHGIFIRRTPHITVIYEYILSFPVNLKLIDSQEKKIERVLRKPSDILFEYAFPFLICDKKGTVSLTNDKKQQLHPAEVAIDVLTIFNSASQIAEKIYRDLILTVFLISDQHIYGIIPMSEYRGLIQLTTAPFTSYEEVYRKLRRGETLEPADSNAHNELIQIITQFQKYFQ